MFMISVIKALQTPAEIYERYIDANGRRTGLVTFCVETAFYNGLLKERYKRG
jgi:hypothetical protein